MGNNHLSLLKSAIETSKRNLRIYSETIDMLVESNSKGSELANITYLSALSELAKSYSQYNLEDNIEQLINFFTIADTISVVQNGIFREAQLKRQFNDEKELHNARFYQLLKESTTPSNNYPGATTEYDRRKVELLSQFEVIHDRHKSGLSRCKDMIYPAELLQRKSDKPFIDKDGNEYPSIIEYVNYVMNLQEEMQKSNGSAQKR